MTFIALLRSSPVHAVPFNRLNSPEQHKSTVPHASETVHHNSVKMAQQISSKEQTLFRQLVKFYEAKQHKKAIKTADQILKKNPDYADTIAMKVRLW